MRKGQVSLEFLASSLFIIIVLTAILLDSADYVGQISERNDRATVNLEARRVTEALMTSAGRHSYGTGGTDWERNRDTIDSVEQVGLARDHYVIDSEKLNSLSTRGTEKLNYTRFREVAGIENQYRFEFILTPILNTEKEFTRTRPPRNPSIKEPENDQYRSSGNRVGYGQETIQGNTYRFLTTSHNGIYDTLYLIDSSRGWDFTTAERYTEGERFVKNEDRFEVSSFDNAGAKTGDLVVLTHQVKTVGSAVDISSSVTKLNRYAAYSTENSMHPMRIEVLSWQ